MTRLAAAEHAVAVAAMDDILPHRSARRFLHRDALRLGTFAERGLLVLSETQCHGHARLWYRSDTERPYINPASR